MWKKVVKIKPVFSLLGGINDIHFEKDSNLYYVYCLLTKSKCSK